MPRFRNSIPADKSCLSSLVSLVRRRPKTTAHSPAPVPTPEDDIQPPPSAAETQTAILPDTGVSIASSSSIENDVEGQGKNPIRIEGDSELWYEALRKSDDQTREAIQRHRTSTRDENKAAELIAMVRNKQENFANTTAKIKIGNREIIWRDHATRVVTWVTNIGDIAVPFAPSPSSTVWSALKVLMQAHVSRCEDLVAILDCAEKVLRLVQRGRTYEAVYIRQLSHNYSESRGSLRNALIEAYKQALKLLVHAADHFQKGKGKRFVDALMNPKQGETLVNDLTKADENLSRAVQASESEHRQMDNAETRRCLERLNGPLRYIDDKVGAMLQHIEQSTLYDALMSISDVDVAGQHEMRTFKRTKGTCEWLLEHEKFHCWEDSYDSSILWLKGRVGTGKSTLTSKVIDRYRIPVEEVANQPAIDEGFAFFYCSKSGTKGSKEDMFIQVLRSFLRQLATVPHHPEKIDPDLIKLCKAMKLNNQTFSIESCQKRIAALLEIYPRTIIVLDALDECERSIRRDLIAFFTDLIDGSTHPIKVFVSSRDEGDIGKLLATENVLSIDIDRKNERDIEMYLDTELVRACDHWSPRTKKKVKQKLFQGSMGMFRWTYLQMEQLKDLISDEAVDERLGKLPEGLTKAYDELYNSLETHDRVLLQRTVKWLIHGAESLSTSAMLSAIRLSETIDEHGKISLHTSTEVSEPQLQAICRHLVVLDDSIRDPTETYQIKYHRAWRFAHASVTEYFEDHHQSWAGDSAVMELAKLSLLKVNEIYPNMVFKRTEDEDSECGLYSLDEYSGSDGYLHFSDQSDFEKYITNVWPWHIQAVQRKSLRCQELSILLERFLIAPNETHISSQGYRNWHSNTDDHFEMVFDLSISELEPMENSFFIIWSLDLYSTAQECVEPRIDLFEINKFSDDALSLASQHGHVDLCYQLILKGSDADRILPGRGSAFFHAINLDNIPCVELLLKHGANPNQNACHRPLCSSLNASQEMIEVLFKVGADPNLSCHYTGCHGEWPFGKVVSSHHDTEMTKRFIEGGADVNLQIGIHGGPLAKAAYHGLMTNVKLLIENNAQVNAHLMIGNYGTALAAAIFGAHLETVKYLIEEAGADVREMINCLPFPRPEIRRRYEAEAEVVRKYLIEEGYMDEKDFEYIGYTR
ncbi:hypothetical protein FPOA_03430 [Fusarium poae]|uniref:NACHT domain-containing protein n=1 Tax=Fusarium poae TaxID=36050 RepID=A0A1B8B9V3_FUSPO|nr:hypothetical protein FPOA_03430 [Fusarium poae]